MAFLKIVLGTSVGLITLNEIAPNNRFDRNIIKPIRDYNAQLGIWNRIQTQKEFVDFEKNLFNGIVNFFNFSSE
jgi:hypothetical protein